LLNNFIISKISGVDKVGNEFQYYFFSQCHNSHVSYMKKGKS